MVNVRGDFTRHTGESDLLGDFDFTFCHTLVYNQRPESVPDADGV
ncbi:hypothetical protein [Allorhizobium borbori]|uniref:Uncharacterized protein n=1 Tax=Allorhizobium borbori TaxID=485907 RepID=A0A7W6K357_9HYPH|nr:hypothetical protein [Allorhizobium borbori]MBB4103205.1 hypothetical protein [Allorhizobium borbori]